MADEWMRDTKRNAVVRVSLDSRIQQLRERAVDSRRAYREDYMRIPCEYLADAFDAAADLLASRLSTLAQPDQPAQRKGKT